MAKFQAASIRDLMTPERDAGRVSRAAQYAADKGRTLDIAKLSHIVAVEADDGSWFELDADDFANARALAVNQVDKMNARGASVWQVWENGKLGRHSKFLYCGEIEAEFFDYDLSQR